MQDDSMLRIVSLPSNLKYASWQLPGALDVPYLEAACLERLIEADKYVRGRSGERCRIIVWDALRSLETQQFIYEAERQKFVDSHPEMPPEQVDLAVSCYVRPPRLDLPPPHSTGGAVDVTLLVDGRDDLLGLFDDFSEVGRQDYYDHHPANTAAEIEQSRLRSLLKDAMESAGFVGILEEWWHWEYGTRHWAAQKGEAVLFNRVLLPPARSSIAEGLPDLAARFTVHVHGVAQAFPSPQARADALQGITSSYYYVRTRHPNEHQLRNRFAETLGLEDVLILPSGLSACIAAVAPFLNKGDTVAIDRWAYYETRRSLTSIGSREGRTVTSVDMSSTATYDDLVALQPAIIFSDHPRNWYLTRPDLSEMRRASSLLGVPIVLDSSLQPLQKLYQLGFADLSVLSLTKYPTQGETVGGLVGGNATCVAEARQFASAYGMVIAPEAAATAMSHFASLEDRMLRLSQKATSVAEAVRRFPGVKAVREADLSDLMTPNGGQVCIEFETEDMARAVEQVVGWNCGTRNFPLTLACTFGASFTTFEHFRARQARDTLEDNGFAVMPTNFVRVGIGHETEADIIAALKYSILMAMANIKEKSRI